MNLPQREREILSEAEYRQLKGRLSYSAIKLYDSDRNRFYKEFILGEVKEEKDSPSLILGSLLHTMLAKQDIDEKFYLFSAVEPKPQMKSLADAVYNRYIKSLSEDNVQQDSFTVIFADAVQAVKYDTSGNEVAFKGKDLNKITEMFSNSDAEYYFQERLKCIGKTVITPNLITKAEKLVDKLKSHSFTYEIINTESSLENGIDVYYELAITFDIHNVPFKSMIDKVVVDHINCTIQPYDYKTSFDNEDPAKAYLKFGYYLQAGLYSEALHQWSTDLDYKILPMKFIFCDTSGFADPTILSLTEDDIFRGWEGFSIRGWKYAGLNELINNIAWNVETGNWATTRDIFKNKGVVALDFKYD